MRFKIMNADKLTYARVLSIARDRGITVLRGGVLDMTPAQLESFQEHTGGLSFQLQKIAGANTFKSHYRVLVGSHGAIRSAIDHFRGLRYPSFSVSIHPRDASANWVYVKTQTHFDVFVTVASDFGLRHKESEYRPR